MNKLLISIALGSLVSTAFAQSYELTGTAPKGVHEVMVRHLETRQTDTLTVAADGKFSVRGEADGNVFAIVFHNDGEGTGNFVKAYLDGKVHVDLERLTASGTTENEMLTHWEQKLKPYTQQKETILAEYREAQEKGNLTDSLMKQLSARYETVQENYSSEAMNCCRTCTQHQFPAIYLHEIIYDVPKEELIALADSQPAYFQQKVLKSLRASLDGWRRQAVGIPFTDLEMPDTAGVARRLSDYVGKGYYVLVDFWASWCGPCRAEMPAVKALYEKYHARHGFDIIGLSFDQKREAWLSAIRTLGLPWHHLSDLKGWKCVAGEVYGVNSIPATLLIGPDGKIVAAGLHAEDLAGKLKEIYGE